MKSEACLDFVGCRALVSFLSFKNASVKQSKIDAFGLKFLSTSGIAIISVVKIKVGKTRKKQSKILGACTFVRMPVKVRNFFLGCRALASFLSFKNASVKQSKIDAFGLKFLSTSGIAIISVVKIKVGKTRKKQSKILGACTFVRMPVKVRNFFLGCRALASFLSFKNTSVKQPEIDAFGLKFLSTSWIVIISVVKIKVGKTRKRQSKTSWCLQICQDASQGP